MHYTLIRLELIFQALKINKIKYFTLQLYDSKSIALILLLKTSGRKTFKRLLEPLEDHLKT